MSSIGQLKADVKGTMERRPMKYYYLLETSNEGTFVSVLHMTKDEFKAMWNAFMNAESPIAEEYCAPPVLYDMAFSTKEEAEDFYHTEIYGDFGSSLSKHLADLRCMSMYCGQKEANRALLETEDYAYYSEITDSPSSAAIEKSIAWQGYGTALDRKDIVRTIAQRYEEYLKTAPKTFLNPYAEEESWISDPVQNKEELDKIVKDYFLREGKEHDLIRGIRISTYDGEIPVQDSDNLINKDGTNSPLLDLYECVGHIQKVEDELHVKFYHEPFTKMVDAYMDYRKTAKKGNFDPYDSQRVCIDFKLADWFVRGMVKNTVSDFLKEQIPWYEQKGRFADELCNACVIVQEIISFSQSSLYESLDEEDLVEIKKIVFSDIESAGNIQIVDACNMISSEARSLIHEVFEQVLKAKEDEWDLG